AQTHGLALVHGSAVGSHRVGVARGDELGAKAQALGDHQTHDRGQGQHAEPADVHPDEDQGVPEERPVRGHVDGRQTRHADGRDGREERVGE
ncbi:hypothetical protein ABE10_00775, partial [Bacillus toyonensis]|nr:hypothetical protein [Bacillus toyonensis]